MDSAVKRPWSRLHWVTWIVVALVIASLLYCECEERPGIIKRDSEWSYFGWPRAHLQLVESWDFYTGRSSFQYNWRWTVFGSNLAICILIVGSTTYVSEVWLRSPNRLQFNLRVLLVFVGVVAAMLSLLANSNPLDTIHWVRYSFLSWDDLSRPLRWPIIFGLSCTFFSLGWLALALLRRACRLVRP